MELIIKFYPQTQTGISRQVHNNVPGDQFYIHGPIGRGLELDRYNSSGINIIFAGGTGILPFMDLFAYIGRKLLQENEPGYAIFPDEQFTDLSETAQFVIYATFPTREDCFGVDFIEKVEKLHHKYKKGAQFKLHLSLTKEGGQKMSNDQIIELLSDYKNTHGRINKLYVCGPPQMNVQFQKLIPVIKERTGLDNEDYAIL